MRFFFKILGIAMGKAFEPNLANLLPTGIRSSGYIGLVFILNLLCISDSLMTLFLIWPGSLRQLQAYQGFLNSIIPDIKITLIHKKFITEFLDTTIIYKQYSCDFPLFSRLESSLNPRTPTSFFTAVLFTLNIHVEVF